jgi:hypothetical protein
MEQNGETQDALRAHLAQRPADYTTWTQLITMVEGQVSLLNFPNSTKNLSRAPMLSCVAMAQNDIEKIRKVYDDFLAEFPLCFGYWKKYAEHEQRHGDFQRATDVYERGVAAVWYDCHMWMHFASSVASKSEDPSVARK